MSYYCYTGEHLRRLFDDIVDYDPSNVTACIIDSIYKEIVEILSYYADCFVLNAANLSISFGGVRSWTF
jgi:hypothetical protein